MLDRYLPGSLITLGALVALLAATSLAAFAVGRVRRAGVARALAWAIVVAAALAAERLTTADPTGARMLAICAVTLAAMKGVVVVEHRASGGAALPARASALFAAWPGMRPHGFASLGAPLDGSGALVRRGLARLAAGLALLGLARVAWIA